MINQGKIEKDRYIKQVEFSKAVLWKDKQISLNPDVVGKLIERNVQVICFEDQKKNERWTIPLVDFVGNSLEKKVGQETQFYCPISLFDREVIRKIELKPITNEIRPTQEKMS